MHPPTGVVEIALIAGLVISAASAGVGIQQSAEQASSQRKLARKQRELGVQQARRQAEEAREQAAQESVQLARETSEARGIAQVSDLAPGALSRVLSDVTRRSGASQAVIERNLELRTRQAQAQAQGAQLTFEGQTLGTDLGPAVATAGLGLAGQALGVGLQITDRQAEEKRRRAAGGG